MCPKQVPRSHPLLCRPPPHATKLPWTTKLLQGAPNAPEKAEGVFGKLKSGSHELLLLAQ